MEKGKKFDLQPYGAHDNRVVHISCTQDGWIQSKGSASVSFKLYPHDGVNYIQICQANRYRWIGSYLSVSKNGYLGAYGWSGATGWRLSGDQLISEYMGQPIGFDGGYMRAHSDAKLATFIRGSNEALYEAFGY